MDKFNKQALSELLKTDPDLAVTIYVPTHISAAPPHISANQTRLKNLSHRAIGDLKGRRNHDLAEYLDKQVGLLHDDLSFIKGQVPGILICAAENYFRVYSLPVNTEEYVSIDKQFYLAPLIGLFGEAQEFYVLELAEHEPKLLIGDLYGLEDTKIKLPTNYRVAVGSNAQDSKPHNNDYGLRSGYPDRFFKIIDNIIYDQADHTMPLIVAGTETETAAYKSLSKYPKLLQTSLTNSYDRSHLDELFYKTRAIIEEELIKPKHRSIINEYLRLEQLEPSRVMQNEQNISQAAEAGRVDKLLTSMTRETTDNVQDDIMHPTTCITFWEPRLNSIMNKLALSVWQMKGLVLNLNPSEMPSKEPIVAELRY